MALIYLDNAASTRPSAEVLEVTARVAAEHFANPSSAHGAGAAAARELESARRIVAAALGAESDEIVFTSGGTEANAMGFVGAARRARGRHLVVSAIEHPAVLKNAEILAKEFGFELTVVSVGGSGVVAPAAVLAAVRPETAVVAVMLVNNELGTVQPVASIAEGLRARARVSGMRPHLHVDAVQAFGRISARPAALGADSFAISGHKINGPKGTGALWLRRGSRITPLWHGGGQEGSLRSGTENVAAIAGFARAAALAAQAHAAGAGDRIAALRDQLETSIWLAVPQARATVAAATRAPHISSISLPGLPAEPILHALEARGVLISAGSACASKTRGPSPVLRAIGVDDRTAVLRFSLSGETTMEEVHLAARAFSDAVADVESAVPTRERVRASSHAPYGDPAVPATYPSRTFGRDP